MRLLIMAGSLLMSPVAWADSLTVTFPDAQTQRIVDALADRFGYRPGPETKRVFVQRLVAAHLKELVVYTEAQRDGQAAERATRNQSERDLDIR